MSRTPIDADEVGRRVRSWRGRAGLSQSLLAQRTGLSPSYVSLIESGRRAPSEEALASLAAALDVGADELAHGSQSQTDQRTGLALDRAQLDLSEGRARAALDRLLALDLDPLRPAVRVQVLLARSQAHEVLGDLEAAVVILEQVLADARRRGDQLDACAATMALLGCLIESGDLSRAIAEGKTEPSAMEAAGLAGTDEHLRLGATLLWAQAERGDLLSASVRAGCLIQQAESLGTTRGRGSVYWTAAMVAEECGDLTLAKRYTERAVALLGEHDGPRDLPRLRLHYAHVLLAQSPPEPAEAEAQIDRAEPLIQASGSEMEKSTADIHRSRAHLMLGDPDRALDLATTALARLTDGPRLDESEANIVLGEALDALGQRDLALDAYRMAAEQLTGMGAVRRAVAAWRRLADRLRSAGEMGLALEAYSRGLDAAGVRAHLAPPAAGRLLDPQDRI